MLLDVENEPTDTITGSDDTARKEARGNIRDVLIQTALQMVHEEGVDAISVREVARRAGVSSGAPFRHFKDRNALLAAIAEEGMREMEVATIAAVDAAGPDPVAQLQAIGIEVVRFAAAHPAHFRVIHQPGLEPSDEMRRLLAVKTERMQRTLEEAQRQGLVREGPPELLMLTCVAAIYGVARFFVDGLPSCPLDTSSVSRASTDAIVKGVVALVGEGVVTPKYWKTVGRDRPRFADTVGVGAGEDPER